MAAIYFLEFLPRLHGAPALTQQSAHRMWQGDKVACPSCGSAKVQKAPMAPRIGKGERRSAPAPESKAPEAPAAEGGVLMSKEMAAKAAELRRELGELRSKIEANCDYVGGRFAEEARKIHYGETEARGIYGETSDKEARELHEEGVEFSKIPWLPQHDS